MTFSLPRTALAMLALAMPGAAWAHVVPNMTVEADFAADGGYTLSINVDPRTFLAADPTTLPPVPGSWYREQTPEQLAATHEKAGEYLTRALGLLFGGQKTPLPNCAIQAIDGESNTPLTAETQEVHLLASAQGRVPAGAASFQIDFAKDANTTLILLPSHGGKAAPRPQVIFPGETSRAYPLETSTPAPTTTTAPAPAPQPPAPLFSLGLVITLSVVVMLLIVGWRLLNHYRHHHRAHRRPRPDDVNN
uniref:hypothetical protein n=1 Tax=Prosthecobacter sp. TaxID=1965333 RepID=UPI0037849C83